CFYYATDPKYGYPDDSDEFIDVYPEYDFSCLARWAWAGMRAESQDLSGDAVSRVSPPTSGFGASSCLTNHPSERTVLVRSVWPKETAGLSNTSAAAIAAAIGRQVA
ncbi:MAG: hypothetical protein M1541_15900, partial [Acidobacteria bacterium]|nr:hypothetical protein [Acidobacteriota bacterium]